MKLINAARKFDTLVCTDAYTGATAFKAQLGLFDDNKRDSETAERRILSMADSAVLPARRVVSAAGTKYIIGRGRPDEFQGQVIRKGYTVHEGTHLAKVRTVFEVLTGGTGIDAWAGESWVKNLAYSEQSSELSPQYHIHFSPSEFVDDNHIVDFNSRIYIVRSTYEGGSGLLVATCDQLPRPVVETAQIKLGEYTELTDTISTSGASAPVLRLRWQSMFEYRSPGAPKFGPDDMQLCVNKSVGVSPGTVFTLSDGEWYAASVTEMLGVHVCRVTRHG